MENSKLNTSIQNKSIIESINFENMIELDPSLQEGYKLLYESEVPIEIRLIENEEQEKEMGTLESIKIRIIYKEDINCPEEFKIEITSESDLFFHYRCILNEEICEELVDKQNLNIDYPGFFKLIQKMFKNILNEPHIYYGILKLYNEGDGILEFIQNLEYKYVDLLSLNFNTSPENIIRESITFRYNSSKAKMLFFQNKLNDLSKMIKTKNPSLLINYQKKNKLNQTQSTIKSKIN